MDNLAVKISFNLKNLRSKRGWSLDATSQKTGVSKAMLGQIERGESSPTIATLWKISAGFDVSFSSFIDDVQPYQRGFIHRKPELQQMHKQDDKINVMPIFPQQICFCEPIFISPPHQKGVTEHVIPVSGAIEILVEGTWHKVHQQEGFRFSADLPHGYRNLSDKPSLFHDMIHYREM